MKVHDCPIFGYGTEPAYVRLTDGSRKVYLSFSCDTWFSR